MDIQSMYTIVTDLLVKYPKKLGLPYGAKVSVENGGAVVGRTVVAKHIFVLLHFLLNEEFEKK